MVLKGFIECLSKGVFERRASNGSDVFSLLICLDAAKFVMLSLPSSCRGDVPKMWVNYCRILQNVHFRLTCIAQKSLCSP